MNGVKGKAIRFSGCCHYSQFTRHHFCLFFDPRLKKRGCRRMSGGSWGGSWDCRKSEERGKIQSCLGKILVLPRDNLAVLWHGGERFSFVFTERCHRGANRKKKQRGEAHVSLQSEIEMIFRLLLQFGAWKDPHPPCLLLLYHNFV